MLSLYLVPATTSLQPGSHLTIDGDEAHHIVRVARQRVGERITLSDGQGQRSTALIERIDQDSVTMLIEDSHLSEKPKVELRVIQALTKSDRAHECVELLVAAGVDEIVPWKAERSIGKWDQESSGSKWEQWIRAAVKQTRRDRIPKLASLLIDLSTLDGLSVSERDGQEVIVALHEEASESLDSQLFERIRSSVSRSKRITVIIGPEGGLAESELAILESARIMQVRLGTPIFRSAHAGAIALTSVQASFSLWR